MTTATLTASVAPSSLTPAQRVTQAALYLVAFIWAARTIRKQDTLVYLIALGVFLAGCGRLLSISIVGLPQPAAVWLGYLVPELLLPVVMVVSHRARPGV